MSTEPQDEAQDMSQIDSHLRVLQNRLVDLKGELSYIAEDKYAETEDRSAEPPKKFSDEGDPTIPGLLHMVNKANVHANHCLTLIHKIRGNAPLDEPRRG